MMKKLLIVILLVISACNCLKIYLVQAHTAVTLTETQFLEMRAVEIKDLGEDGKQLVFELRANDINFQGFDVRFGYDTLKYTPSNLSTNENTDDETKYYAMSTEFQNKLELFTLPESEGTIRAIVSFSGTVANSEHIQSNTVIGSDSDVLIGRMSFKMLTDTFDPSDFQLIEDANSSPKTGIKITIDGTNPTDMKTNESQTSFRFTDKTASKDATLSNLIVSSGVKDDDPELNTYKEYALTPTFNSETLAYEVTLLEYKDVLDVTAVQSDAKATMKIEVPKRNENGELEYEADGETIKQEEKDIQDNTPIEVTINKLGEPDTRITVKVTAEDGKTKNEYVVTIKRPYATIKGSVIVLPTNWKSEYTADIKVYSSEDVSKTINWDTVVDGAMDDVHSKLSEVNSINKKTNNDGKYEFYIIPEEVDILIDKPGYLDEIYIKKNISEGEVLDLGEIELTPGDVNKDGVIQLKDISTVVNLYGLDSTSPDYDINCDFNEDENIQLQDTSYVIANFSKARIIHK